MRDGELGRGLLGIHRAHGPRVSTKLVACQEAKQQISRKLVRTQCNQQTESESDEQQRRRSGKG